MEEWIPLRAFVVPRWFKSRKIYKRVLLAGALTTSVIIITWKFRSRKSKSRHSSNDFKTPEDEIQGYSHRLQTSCIDSSASITTCNFVDDCQLEAIAHKEEIVDDFSTVSIKYEVDLSEREDEPDSKREAFLRKYYENHEHCSEFGSMLSFLQSEKCNGTGGSTLLVHEAASSASSSAETDSGLGCPSFFSKADTSSTYTTPISKHTINSKFGMITESNWFVDMLHGQSVHKLYCQPPSLSTSHLYGENSEGFGISACAMQSKIRQDTQVLHNTPIPPAKFWCRGNIADSVDDTNNCMEDHCHSQTNEPHTYVPFVASKEMACFGLLNGEIHGLLDSNENQSRNIENVGASQGSYHAKLHTYNDYLMDPKLSLQMKSQVQRAKASLQTFYEIGEPQIHSYG